MHDSSKTKDCSGIDNKRRRKSSDLRHILQCTKCKTKIRPVSEHEVPYILPELFDKPKKKHHHKKKKHQKKKEKQQQQQQQQQLLILQEQERQQQEQERLQQEQERLQQEKVREQERQRRQQQRQHRRQQQQQQQHKIKENILNKKVKKKKSLKVIDMDKPKSHIVNDLNKFFIVQNKRLKDLKKNKHREYKENNQHGKELLEENNDLNIRKYINNLFDKFRIKPEPKEIDIIYTRPPKKPIQNREEDSKNDAPIKRNNMKKHSDDDNAKHVKRHSDDDNVKHVKRHSDDDNAKHVKRHSDDDNAKHVKRHSDDDNAKHVKKDIKHKKTKSKDDEIKQIKKLILQEIKSEEQKSNNRKKVIAGTKRLDNLNGILDSELTVYNNKIITHSQVVRSTNCIRSVSVAVPAKSFHKIDFGCQVSMIKLTQTHHPSVTYVTSTDLQRSPDNRNEEKLPNLTSKIPVLQKIPPLITNNDNDNVSLTTKSPKRSPTKSNRQKMLNIPPKIVEIQYLTDLARGEREDFTNDWLNQKYCNLEYGKERLKIEGETVEEQDQETDSIKDSIQSPRKHKLKIKENTFNLNFKTQTKIHICRKPRRLNRRKCRSCSRRKSTISIKEHPKQVTSTATNTDNDFGTLTESLNQLLRDNSDFLKKDFSYVTESIEFSKFDENSDSGKSNADNDDRVLSLTTINQKITSVKIENHEKMFIDFSTILNSKNDEYFTLKSIEDVLNETKLEDYGLKLSSLSSLESKDFDTCCSCGSNPAYSVAKSLSIEKGICPKPEIYFTNSEEHLEDKKNNGRSEFIRFFRYIFKTNKWKISKSLSCIQKVKEK